MSEKLAVWVVLGLAFVAANLPFLFERVLFVMRPPGGVKNFAWRLLEMLLLWLLVGIFAAVLEKGSFGGVYPQGWEFYVTTLCLFVVFAFPGFIYRYLWHARRAS